MNIKFFNLSKVNKIKDTQPDYRISFKTEDTFVEGGACWKKQDKNGQTFLSCKLGDEYIDHTDSKKSRKGYHIEVDSKDEDKQPESVDEF
jgi:uncharacterized protein (DUF736 family)